MPQVLVVAEAKNGEVRKPTLELLSFARSRDLPVEVTLIGSGVSAQADLLAGQGASRVYLADDPSLAIYNTAQYTSLVQDAAVQSGATQIWLTSSEMGRDLTPRLAARLGVGALSDVTSLEIEGDKITVNRPCMATKLEQQCRFTREVIRVVSIRAGSYEVQEASPSSAETVTLSIPEGNPNVDVRDIQVEESNEIELNEASIVVSVGRGTGGTEGCDFVRPLAAKMGAAFGASRAVCDAGWMPHKHQVGQTGTVVSPDFYFAFGISGAIQHLAGMKDSEVIVAINNDPDAPMCRMADLIWKTDLFGAMQEMIDHN